MNQSNKPPKPKQNAAGYIRQHLADFERQIVVGISADALLEDVRAKGYDITMNTFRDCLKKARKWWRENPEQTKSLSTPLPQLPQQGAHHAPVPASAVTQPPKMARTPKVTNNTDPLTKCHGFTYKGAEGIDDSELF